MSFFLLLVAPRWCRLSCPGRGSFPPRCRQTRAFEVTDATAGVFFSSPLVEHRARRGVGPIPSPFLFAAGGPTWPAFGVLTVGGTHALCGPTRSWSTEPTRD